MTSPDFLSVLPIIVTLALALYTKHVVIGLFGGVVTAVVLLTGGNPLEVLAALIKTHLVGTLTDSYNAGVIVLMVFIGGFVALMEKSGGGPAFATKMTGVIASKAKAQIAAWCGGIFKEKSVNVSWNHDLPGDFSLNTWLGYAQKSTEWNTGAVISPMNLTDMFAGILPGSFGLPGETVYRYQDSGAEAARVASATGFDRTVVSSNLPSPILFDGAGGVTQFAMYQLYETDEVFFKSVLNKEAGDHSLAFGIELSKADIDNTGGSGGAGVATLEEQPQMLDITHILPNGTELIVTDPAGFGAHANAFSSGVKYEGSQKQLSLFVGDTWYVNDVITIDAAVRYEKINYDAMNTAVNRNVPATAYNDGGGADGNPATLYDNQANETLELNVERDYDYFAYTGSVTHQWSPDVTTYVRYSNSKKAPDMGSVVLLDTPFRVENEFAQPQKIEQLEIGIKYLTDDWNIALFPFYSGLTNVGAIQQFTDEFGRNYLTPTRFGEVTTYGVEADVDWEITSTLRVRSALTL